MGTIRDITNINTIDEDALCGEAGGAAVLNDVNNDLGQVARRRVGALAAMMEAVVCQQSGVSVQAVHTYYPHKGVLNVVDLTSMQSTEQSTGQSTGQSTDVWALWQRLRTTGETIVVPNPPPVDAEVMVVDTESWESCVVDDVYR